MIMRALVLLSAAALQAASVKDFGAAGDGAADDTAALQRAADAGPVDLPAGRYRITRSVELRLDRVGPAGITGALASTIVMTGPGPALRITGTHKTSADPERMNTSVRDRERFPVIAGFTILGAHAEADGIRLEGLMQAAFRDLLLRDLRDGIVMTGLNRNVLISGVHVYHNRGVGILLDKLDLHQVNISNSHISYNRGGGIVVRNSVVRNLHIGTCDIEANMSATGPPTANVWLDTVSGSIREGAITGSTLQHDGKAKGSANIRFTGQGTRARQKVGYFSISDNVISAADFNIHLRYARGVNITGNTFALGFSHNLLVESSSDITVGPNTMDQNPDYDQAGFRNAVVFDDSSDTTINGLHINRSRRVDAALVIRRSHHFNVTGVTILDSDGMGILLDQTGWTLVSGCLIDDRRPERKDFVAVSVREGKNNSVTGILTSGRTEP